MWEIHIAFLKLLTDSLVFNGIAWNTDIPRHYLAFFRQSDDVAFKETHIKAIFKFLWNISVTP